jgi:hypothetical protein
MQIWTEGKVTHTNKKYSFETGKMSRTVLQTSFSDSNLSPGPYYTKFVDMNEDVNPNVAYIHIWDGTHQWYRYVRNKSNFPSTIY